MSKLNRSKVITAILLILVVGFSVTSLSYATQTPLFSILPPVAALPTINLAPSSGAVGTVVTITGTGFLGTDTSCVVTGTGTIIGIPPATCTIAASTISAGVTFTVGDAAPGTYTITVTGSPGADVATSIFTVLPPAIVLNPTSGPPGTMVTVNGSHFSLTDAACTITGSVVTGATCTIIAGSGNPTGSFVAGTIPPGIYTVTLKGTTTGDTAQASFTIPTPAIVLTPASGPVNTAVTISGGGFNLGDFAANPCIISQAPAAPVIVAASTCTIDTSGNMAPSGFSVATTATPGTYTITVTGGLGDSASKTFTVTTSAPFIVPTPNAAAIGTHIAVTGGGFNSGDVGTCTFGQSPSSPVIVASATCTITGSGQLSGSGFTVAPSATPGTYLLTVTGTTGDIGQAGFTVTGPNIVLSPTSGPVTSPVSVTGNGFNTADAGLCSFLQSPASPVLFASVSCTITGSGALTGSSFTVANTATPGTYLVQVQGSSGDISGTAAFKVTGASPGSAKITLSPNTGGLGSSVTLTGTGFSLGDTFCNIGPSTLATTPLCTITAGSGAPSGSFFVGGVSPGTYTVTVTGSTGDSAQATFTVTGPKIVLTPNSGVTGIAVTVTGSGFSTTDATCTITGGPIVVAMTCTVASGNVAGGFSVGGVPAGTYTITVTGTPAGDSASASFTVISHPTVTLIPNSGPPGTTVVMNGAGFSAADTTCTISGGPLVPAMTCSFVTPGNGAPSGSFSAGLVNPGTYTVTVTGSTGDAGTATFTVLAPFITLSPNAAPVGTKITVTGGQFNTGDAGICTFSQAPASPFVVSSSSCTITATGQLDGAAFIINGGATPGIYTITVNGLTGDSASAQLTVTTNTPFIVLTPATAPIGTNIAVTGGGFNTGDTGTCTFGQSPSSPIIIGAPATCTINSSGALIGSGFPVATSAIPGKYTVTVTGTTGDIASATFVVQGPQVTLTPSSGSIGTNVAATGFGFNTADAGLCSFLQSPAAPVIFASVSCTITPLGTLTGSGFTVATTATPGTYLVQVKGSTGDISDPGFTVTVNAPTVNVNPTSGTTGAAISVTGSGFVAADAGLCSFLQSPASPVLFASVSCAINAAGQLVGSSFTVAVTATTGSYIVTVKGSTGDTGSTTFFVTKGPQIILSPVSGHQGTGVTITGTGFSSNDAGACTITSGLVGLIGPSTCTITSAGTLQSTSFSVGSVAPATATVTVTGGTGDSASATFIVVTNTPSLTLTPNSGPVLAGITMTGSGFNTGDTATCTASSTPTNIVILTACTLSNGQLTGSSFQVASVATPGLYVVTVTGSSGDFATQAFVVTVTGPTITLTPSTGPSGTAVAVTGHGFNLADVGLCSFLQSPSAPVLFTSVACAIDSTGTLSATSFTVASPITPGTYVVSVKGSTGDTASANFVVTGPSIKVNPVSGPIGTNIGVTGSGFNTGDVGACSFLQSPASPVIFASVSCSIALSGGVAQLSASSFMVATTATPGPYTVSVKGSTGDIASTTFVVTTTVPSLVLTPNSGPINTHVFATGASFNPADAGTCIFGQVPAAPVIITSTSCTINSSGQLSASGFTIATTALPGTYAVTVKGSTLDVATAAFTVTVNGPTIILTPSSGPISTQVAVTGSGFNTADAGTCLYSQSPPTPVIVNVASSCTINTSGQLVTSGFTIAAAATPGVYTITVTGITGDTGSATFTVTSNAPVITVSPTGGPIGTGVTVAGTGFSTADGAGAGLCTFLQSPTAPILFTSVSCTITTAGQLSGSSFTVANTATPGTYTVSAKGSSGDIASANFVVTGPQITFAPASGPDGTVVTVSGTGFALTDTTCMFASTPAALISVQICTIANGKITSASFTVGTAAPNARYTVTATGNTAADVASAGFTVNPFSPKIGLTPSVASDGSVVTISGSGFNPSIDAGACVVTSTPLNIVTGYTCTITAIGQIAGGTSTFTVPLTAAPPGTYTITVTGISGDSAEFSFVVSSIGSLSIIPGTGARGSTVGVTGAFPSGVGSTCSIGSTTGNLFSSSQCVFGIGNTFSATFVVSSSATPGAYLVTASSGTCNSCLSAVFVVQGPFIQLSDPAAIGQVISGPTGTHVSIEGSFFPLSDTTCSISQGSGSGGGTFIVNGACSEFAGSGPFAGYNNVTGSFVVGNVQEGQYVVQVSSSGSGTFAQAVFNVTAGAFIQLAGPGPSGFASVGKAASGPSGSSVKVSGSQFQPGDVNSGTCSISAISGGNAIAGGSSACSFFKAPNGFVNVTGSFIVGTANPGQYAIQISGSQGDSAQAILNVTAGAFIQLFPTSGTVGSHVSVEGSNFQPGSTTCTIGVAGGSSGNFIAGGTSACATFTAANGFRNVTASFTVGNVQPGDYVIQVSGSQGEFAQALFTVTSGPFIQLSGASGGFVNVGQVAQGPSGSVVHVEGSAFLTTDTSCTIGVSSGNGNFIAGGTQACSTFTAQSGIFKGATNVTASFTVGNVQPGEYVIQISGNQGDFAQAIFEVNGGRFIQVSTGPPNGFASVGQPAKGQVGSHVSVEGTNFLTTDTSCTIGVSSGNGNFISGGTSACAVFTISTGATNVTASFRIGNVQPGQYLIQVSGNQGDFAQALVNVTSGPFIQLSSGPPNGFASVGQVASGPTGSHVSISGSDFVSTDTTCTIGVGGGTSGSFIAAGSGCTLFTAGNGFQNVTASFTVGNVAPGQYVVQISGNQGDFAQALFNVTSGPILTISPGSGRLGTDVIINGTNFLQTDTRCTLSSTTGTIITGGACTIVNGVAAGSFIVGNVLPGQYVIVVSGNQGDSGTIIFRVVGGSIITLSPGTGRPGAHVSVNGTGFLPTDSSCTLSSPGSGAVLAGSAACAVVLGSGLTNSSFIIGNVVPGQYLIQISGNQGDFAQAVLNVVGGPSISLSPGTASIGELVLVNGTGFLPTDTSCTLVSGASNTNNPITPSSGGCAITAGTGVANASLIVAGVPPGQYVIQITGSSGDSAQAVLNILIAPSVLSLYPTNATTGATVNFRATGLSTSDTSCTVESGVDSNHIFNQNSIVLTSPACAIGPSTVATGTFIVGPYATEDKNWTIRIRGAPAQDVSELAVFNVTATVIVTPNSGSINSVFTYTGSGFESTATSCTATVIPPFPNAPTLGCYFSPGIGQVSGSIIVPRGAFPGTYGIQILDNTGSSATGVFTVGTPSAQLVLNPASQGQSQQVGFAATGLNPNDTYCAVTAGANPPWIGPDGTAPSCSISGGYASGAFRISDTATGGYYLVTVTGYAQPPASPCPTVGGISANTCAGLGGGDFAQNFLGVTLDTTVTTFSSTTSTSTSTTSQTFTTTSMATSYSYSSSTVSTTGNLYTTYWHGTSTTVFASTTSTFGITTTTTQSWTSVTVSTTTAQTTGCGPLPCPWAIQPQLNAGQSLNAWQPILGPFSDSIGMLAVLLLIIPMLLRRLFT